MERNDCVYLNDANVRSNKSFLKQEAIFQHILMPYKIFSNALKNVQGFTFSNRFSGRKIRDTVS